MQQLLTSKFSLAFLLALSAGSVGAETVGPEEPTPVIAPAAADGQAARDAAEQAAIAAALNNPLSSLWILFSQNDAVWTDGNKLDDLGKNGVLQNTTLLQPVMPFQLTENWKIIFRPVIPINSFDTLDNIDITTGEVPAVTGVDLNRKTGLGDVVLWTALSNSYKPPFVWGFGPTVMLPTASDEQLGTGKYSAGPMALAANITDNWIVGGVAQHWWSFAGEDNINVNTSLGKTEVSRSDVNLTDFQYIIRYRYSPLTNIGAAPNIRYNWNTNDLSLPVGIGFDTMIKLGKLPAKVGAEVYYYVEQNDDFGPQWQLRLFFSPVIPSPNWARNALF